MKKLYLQDGGYVIIDKEDYERCSKHTWSKSITKNSSRATANLNGKYMSLGRFILGSEDGESVIRKNPEKLDYRKSNLLIIDKKNVARYSRARSNSISRYKGVSWCKRRKKWRSYIYADKKNIYLGHFDNEDDAAIAYNNAVDKYRDGEGYKNVIDEDNRNTEKEKDWDVEQHRRKNKTGYKGVYEIPKKYHSYIYNGGTNLHLGVYDTPEQAARAYDEKAIELFGEEAILNFPSERKINK